MLDTIELYWPKGKPSDELEAFVVADIRKWLPELESADQLMFHHVFMDEIENDDAPMVVVSGVEGDHRFHCEYHPTNVCPKLDMNDFPGLQEKLEAAKKKFEEDAKE